MSGLPGNPNPDDGDPPDEATTWAEIERLAKLNVLNYQRECAKAAKRLGLTVSVLDRLVAAKRDEQNTGTNCLVEIVPWPHPVDGAALLDDMAAAIKRHVGVPTRAR